MARPDGNLIGLIEERLEIGEADNMVVVTVGEKQIYVGDALSLQRHAGWHDARSGIKNENVLSAANFDADGIAAIFGEIFA
jgi:hypothetical protein